MTRAITIATLFALTASSRLGFAAELGNQGSGCDWVSYTVCGVSLVVAGALVMRAGLAGAARLRLLAAPRVMAWRGRLRLLTGALVLGAWVFPFLLAREPGLAALLGGIAALSGLMAQPLGGHPQSGQWEES